MVLYQLGVCLLQWMLLIIIATHVHYVWVQVSDQLLWVTNSTLRNCSNKKLIQNTYHAFFVKQFCMSTAFHLAWPVCASFDHISLSLVWSYTFLLFNLLMSWSVPFQLLKDNKVRSLTLEYMTCNSPDIWLNNSRSRKQPPNPIPAPSATGALGSSVSTIYEQLWMVNSKRNTRGEE